MFKPAEATKFKVVHKGFSVKVESTDKSNTNSVSIIEVEPHTANEDYAEVIADLLQREVNAHGEKFLVQLTDRDLVQSAMDERLENIITAFAPYIQRRMEKANMSDIIKALFISNPWGDTNAE